MSRPLKGRLAAAMLMLMTALASGCGEASKEAKISEEGSAMVVTAPLPMPDVPRLVADPKQRAAYAAEHFWAPMELTDSVEPGAMEQNVANFSAIASHAPAGAQLAGWRAFWKRRGEQRLEPMLDLLEDYLYDPESPVYSPDLMMAAIMAADSAGLAPGQRWQELLLELRQDATGEVAPDFVYVDRQGSVRHLHEAGPERLLLFYDPDCEHCRAEIEQLSSGIGMVDSSVGLVLAIYPGRDLGLWAAHASTLPADWIVGHPVNMSGHDDSMQGTSAHEFGSHKGPGHVSADPSDAFPLRTLPVLYHLSASTPSSPAPVILFRR